MQLTRTEIAETQIIVTTPEKWDVVTRKTTGEGELASVGIKQKGFSWFDADIFLFLAGQTLDCRRGPPFAR
jgi:hypothetical protein